MRCLEQREKVLQLKEHFGGPGRRLVLPEHRTEAGECVQTKLVRGRRVEGLHQGREKLGPQFWEVCVRNERDDRIHLRLDLTGLGNRGRTTSRRQQQGPNLHLVCVVQQRELQRLVRGRCPATLQQILAEDRRRLADTDRLCVREDNDQQLPEESTSRLVLCLGELGLRSLDVGRIVTNTILQKRCYRGRIHLLWRDICLVSAKGGSEVRGAQEAYESCSRTDAE